MAALLPPLPDACRPSAVRRFPLGCGRHRHNADHVRTRDALPNPSDETQRLPVPATHFRISGPDRGVGNGPVDEHVPPARRVSAVRMFPPGCGRAVAVRPVPVPEPEVEGEVEDKAGELPAAVRDGDHKGKYVPCHGDSSSNGGGEGDDGGVRPWIATGIMPSPLMPWAHRGRRSQQRRKQF